jgi:hypothetical protein
LYGISISKKQLKITYLIVFLVIGTNIYSNGPKLATTDDGDRNLYNVIFNATDKTNENEKLERDWK